MSIQVEIPGDIADVIEAHDCGVRVDLSSSDEGEPGHPVFGLGWYPEPSAGLRGGSLTPSFDTPEELWAHVRENRETLLAKAEYPDV
jgi:hypothetical protein